MANEHGKPWMMITEPIVPQTMTAEPRSSMAATAFTFFVATLAQKSSVPFVALPLIVKVLRSSYNHVCSGRRGVRIERSHRLWDPILVLSSIAFQGVCTIMKTFEGITIQTSPIYPVYKRANGGPCPKLLTWSNIRFGASMQEYSVTFLYLVGPCQTHSRPFLFESAIDAVIRPFLVIIPFEYVCVDHTIT